MSDPAPHHRFSLQGTQGQLTLAIDAALTAPWTVLFGPSGSGKSTILRALAGLLPSQHHTFDRGTGNPTRPHALAALPPERRSLSYSPQKAPLLPHLSVEANIRFPELLRGLSPAGSRLPELTSLLQLEALLPKQPHQLSGGERQRVSLARALAVPNAQLLLLDEPFSGLDRTLRDTLVPPLRAHLAARALPVLSVTHDPDEALLLGADVLRLHEGRLLAQGPAPAVLADEVARLTTILAGSPHR